MLTFEKAGKQFYVKPIGKPLSCDRVATCPTALCLGHAFSSTLVLAHVHACVHLIAMDCIIFSLFSREWVGLRLRLGVQGELDKLLMHF